MRYLIAMLAALVFAAPAWAQDKAPAQKQAPAKSDAPAQKSAPAKSAPTTAKTPAAKPIDLDALFKKGESQVRDGNHCGPKPKPETPVA